METEVKPFVPKPNVALNLRLTNLQKAAAATPDDKRLNARIQKVTDLITLEEAAQEQAYKRSNGLLAVPARMSLTGGTQQFLVQARKSKVAYVGVRVIAKFRPSTQTPVRNTIRTDWRAMVDRKLAVGCKLTRAEQLRLRNRLRKVW